MVSQPTFDIRCERLVPRTTTLLLLLGFVLLSGCREEPTAVETAGGDAVSPPPRLAITVGDVATGTASGGAVTSVTTGSAVLPGTSTLYLAQVNIRSTKSVASVSGGGLTWTLVGGKTGERLTGGITRVEVWKAYGSPTSSFTVTAQMEAAVPTLTITVLRYDGAKPEVEDVESAGTGGADGTDVSIVTTSTKSGARHFVALQPRHRVISTPDPDYTIRGQTGAGTGGDEINSYTLDHQVASATADTFAVTLNNPADWAVVAFVINPAAVPPVSHGLWISKSELDQLSVTVEEWTDGGEVKPTADATWPATIALDDQNSQAEIWAMAGALAFARLYPADSAETYRTHVASYIDSLVNEEGLNTGNPLAWARNTGAFVIAADLINLEAYDPSLNAQFEGFIHDVLYMSNHGAGMDSVFDGALSRSNNIGNWARWTSVLVSAYLDDTNALDTLASRVKLYMGDRTGYTPSTDPYQSDWGGPADQKNYSWHEEPTDPDTYRGIVRKGVVRDSINNFDGILPEEMRRGQDSTHYVPSDFPNAYGDQDPDTTRYVEEGLDGLLGTLEVLRRVGYPAAVGWSDNAGGRAAQRLWYFSDAFPAKGWLYFEGGHEASRSLVNYLYACGLPESRNRTQLGGATKGFGFTHWTHAQDGAGGGGPNGCIP